MCNFYPSAIPFRRVLVLTIIAIAVLFARP